jgi:phosphohistidine phosphatase
MRLLLLLRHAKAARDAADDKDHSRSLNERGHKAASAMGAWLAARPMLQPGLVLCSTAQRTRETLADVAAALPAKVAVRFEGDLYLAPPEAIIGAVTKAPNTINCLMVIGHNPGIHETARALIGMIGAYPAARLAFDRMREKYPTGALTAVAFPRIRSWSDVAVGKGRFESFTRPKDIG